MAEFRVFTLPNLFTAANMVCGFVGIQLAFSGNLIGACYCIYLAAIVDFFDGFVARLLNASSEMGKQLDSLCDVVSFGVLPGFLIYNLLEEYKWIAAIVPIFAALRLAKFNIDTRQSDGFVGIPTPITALFITSVTFVFHQKVVLQEINYFLLFVTVLVSVLMIAEFNLISLKFKGRSLGPNLYRYLLVFVSVGFVITLRWESFIPIYFFYILLSIIHNKFSTKTHEIHC